MGIVELLTLVGVLASIVSAATEWFKSVLDAAKWDDALSEEVHRALVQLFAMFAGVCVAWIAQLDVVHALAPNANLTPEAAWIISGVAMALPADGLKSILQWVKAIRDAKEGEAAQKWEAVTSEPTPQRIQG